MSGVTSLLVFCVLVSVAAPLSFPGNPLQAVKSTTAELVGTVGEELTTVTQPVASALAYIGSSQCSTLQKILSSEPSQADLDQLKLYIRTKDGDTIINLTEAPAFLRARMESDIVLFLHGYTEDPTRRSSTTVSQAYLDKGRASVLLLDTSALTSGSYFEASAAVRPIGARLGAVLAALFSQGQNPDLIHIVAHSLGAHVAGFAGKEFTRLTGKKIGRITGLDSAGPCFSQLTAELRLKRTDATYVDVIHTNGGVYGLKDTVGHMDYFPNGGMEQPNCPTLICSHSRSWMLYSASVLIPDAFPAVLCEDWAAFKRGDCKRDNISYMGYQSKPGVSGQYYLVTGPDPPYGLGVNGTYYMNTGGILDNVVGIVG